MNEDAHLMARPEEERETQQSKDKRLQEQLNVRALALFIVSMFVFGEAVIIPPISIVII